MNLTDFAENKLADYMRGQALTLPTNWFLALASAADDTGITELSGTGYARVAVPIAMSSFDNTQASGTAVVSTGSSHATANTSAVSWGDPAAPWGTAAFVGFMDASTGGNCWLWIPLATSIVITTGSPNPVQVSAGMLSLTVGLTGGCSDALANKLIDMLFRGQAYAWPATLYTGLFTTAPTSAGGGVEVSGGSYARATLTPSLTTISGTQGPGTTATSSGVGGRISNIVPVDYPAPTAPWGTVVAQAIFDSPSAGMLLFAGPLAGPKTINSGAPAPYHAANTLGLTLS